MSLVFVQMEINYAGTKGLVYTTCSCMYLSYNVCRNHENLCSWCFIREPTMNRPSTDVTQSHRKN